MSDPADSRVLVAAFLITAAAAGFWLITILLARFGFGDFLLWVAVVILALLPITFAASILMVYQGWKKRSARSHRMGERGL